MIGQVFQGGTKGAFGSGPMFGLYRCLYCGLCFSLKRRLNLHYQLTHVNSMPNYEGKRRNPKALDAHPDESLPLNV